MSNPIYHRELAIRELALELEDTENRKIAAQRAQAEAVLYLADVLNKQASLLTRSMLSVWAQMLPPDFEPEGLKSLRNDPSLAPQTNNQEE